MGQEKSGSTSGEMAFPMLDLSDVTLIGVDGINAGRLALAFDYCAHGCHFGAQKLLTPLACRDPRALRIPPLSYRNYSSFLIHDLHRYVDTAFALVVQYDGFILNPRAWHPSFREYDYIGTAWRPPMRGGIGGFSLRSKSFLRVSSQLIPPDVEGNEDIVLCHHFGAELERAGLRFAPPEVCRRFGFDALGSIDGRTAWNGEFGFHNLARTDLSKWDPPDLHSSRLLDLPATVLELGGIMWELHRESQLLKKTRCP